MKSVMHPVTITLFVIILLVSLPMLLPKKEVVLTNTQLRQAAALHNLVSVPKSRAEVLQATYNPQNPPSSAKITLGKQLYFDTRLSRDRSISCATCHLLQEG